MSENYNYKKIFNLSPEENSLILQNLDQKNYFENEIIPKLSKLEKNSKINSEIENNIYLSVLLIK